MAGFVLAGSVFRFLPVNNYLQPHECFACGKLFIPGDDVRLLRRHMPFPLLIALLSVAGPVSAGDEPAEVFGLANSSEEAHLPTAARPASQIAENVTVITADEIRNLHAHTLDEVMQTVPGFQFFQMRTPGTPAVYSLAGSTSRHVQVLLDGVPQNLLGADETAELGMLPVQRIERIEIIKGAASVSWGSALGGAINVITREPDHERKISGTAAASAGERHASDLAGGLSGTVSQWGYLVDGGKYRADGLLPNNSVSLDHLLAKLFYDLPNSGRLLLAADYRDGARGLGQGNKALGDSSLLTDHSASRYRAVNLGLDLPLREYLDLELLGSVGDKAIAQQTLFSMPQPQYVFNGRYRNDNQLFSAKLNWGDASYKLIAGAEYLRDNIRVVEPQTGFFFLNFRRELERYGAYAHGVYTLGPLTVLPGVRFDRIGSHDVTSYSLGATWKFSESTLLRLYGAKGYGLPMPNFQDSLQYVKTFQAGVESSAVSFAWLKGTIFASDTWNIETFIVPPDYPQSPVVNVQSKQDRKGFEIEGRTRPWQGFSLAAGYTYCDVHDRDTGDRVQAVPLSMTKLSLSYANEASGSRAALMGVHVDWPALAGNSVNDRQFVWDLFLTQKLFARGDVLSELFISVRNLFDNAQYIDDFRKNAPRWFEGGLSFKF